MSLALAPSADRFSILTISDAATATPAWNARLGWPSAGDSHLAFDFDRPGQRNIWAAQLDAAVLRADRAVLIVAEGLGCHAASWWARLSPTHYVSRVAGALLFDPDTTDEIDSRRDQFASPRTALPFPSMVVADRLPGSDPAAFAPLANGWGSRLLAGHRQRSRIQPAWRSAQRLVGRLTAVVVEHDVERAMALRGRSD